MDIANTSLVHKAYWMLFTSVPYGKAMHWPERDVFEAWMVCKYCIVDSECKYYRKMHILIDRRMHKIHDCHPNPNAQYTKIPMWIWQRFPRCTRTEWDLSNWIVSCILSLLPSHLRSFCGATKLTSRSTYLLLLKFLANYSPSDITKITSTIRCNASMSQSVSYCTISLLA